VTVLLLPQGSLLSLHEHAVVVLDLRRKVDPLNVTVHAPRLLGKALRPLTVGREDLCSINDALGDLPKVPLFRLFDLAFYLYLVLKERSHLVLHLLFELLPSYLPFLERLQPVQLAVPLDLLRLHHACKLALKHLTVRLTMSLRRKARGVLGVRPEIGLGAPCSLGFDA